MADVLDAVIVGAGLSGLQAALDLHKGGRSVIVLEARDRVGGKICSMQRPDGKGIQEVGATWLNDTNQSHVWSYCERFGLTPIVQNIEGLVASEDSDGVCHFFPFGEMPKFERSEVDNIIAMRDMVEVASRTQGTFNEPNREKLNSITFEQWCRDAGAGAQALLTARLWCREISRGALGIVNLRYDGKDGAQYLRLQEGTQSIPVGMSKLLPTGSIKLNSPVRSITQHTAKVYTVTTAYNHTFTARKVIVSIPGPAYKNVAFTPPLPPQKQTYTMAVRYGCFIKFICLFKTPFWRRKGACGLAQSFSGPINHCRDTSVDSYSNYALTCFLCAGPGLKWVGLSDNDRCETVLKQLGALFGVGYEAVKSEFLDSITSGWMQDKWAGWGCPFATMPPDSVSNSPRDKIDGEKSGGIYFVGTELVDEWRGYMEGALRSGKRGAAQALADLRSDEARL